MVACANIPNLEKNEKKMATKTMLQQWKRLFVLTDLVDKVEATQSNPDKAGVEKEIGEIQALLEWYRHKRFP